MYLKLSPELFKSELENRVVIFPLGSSGEIVFSFLNEGSSWSFEGQRQIIQLSLFPENLKRKIVQLPII